MPSDVWEHKHRHLDDAAVAPLNSLVRTWRSNGPTEQIPWFDPDDGGVRARLLLLMESPAPRTLGANGSGLCSLDNLDASNRRLMGSLQSSGIPRGLCLKWNMVPWTLSDDAGRPRAPKRSDLEQAAPRLRDVLGLLPDLDVVLTLGHAALSGFMLAVTEQSPAQLLRVIAVPHPSQRNTASRELAARRIDNALNAIATYLTTA